MLIPTQYQPKAVLKLVGQTQEDKERFTLPRYEPDDDIILSLTHVALKIRGDIMALLFHLVYNANFFMSVILMIIITILVPDSWTEYALCMQRQTFSMAAETKKQGTTL